MDAKKGFDLETLTTIKVWHKQKYGTKQKKKYMKTRLRHIIGEAGCFFCKEFHYRLLLNVKIPIRKVEKHHHTTFGFFNSSVQNFADEL